MNPAAAAVKGVASLIKSILYQFMINEQLLKILQVNKVLGVDYIGRIVSHWQLY